MYRDSEQTETRTDTVYRQIDMGPNLLDTLRDELPLNPESFSLPPSHAVGLVIVDEVNGFCSVGCGNLVIVFFFFC